MSQTEPETSTSTVTSNRDWESYVVPMATFLVLTALEGQLPKSNGAIHPVWYPAMYMLKIAIVTGLALRYRAAWRDMLPRPSVATLALAVVSGALVTALWVGLDGRYPTFGFLGTRSAFVPSVIPPLGRYVFLTMRLFGLVLLVPLVEELFWRSFLLRWIINPDFRSVPIGRVTPAAAVITSVLFAAAHPEWLPALLTGSIWAGLLWRTKSLSACLASHAVANLALAVYVFISGEWKYL
jgi:uncharacterized protein